MADDFTDCTTGAMTVRQKDSDDQYVPPSNIFETYMKMDRERGKM
jgi:hypothetical protein